MAKYRVAVRDGIGREDLRRFALRWAAFGASALAVVVAALLFSR